METRLPCFPAWLAQRPSLVARGSDAVMQESRDVAAAMLQFEERLRECGSAPEVAFTAVNEIFDVLRFEQAVLWRADLLSRPSVKAASGLADVSPESPYVQWLEKLIRSLMSGSHERAKSYSIDDLPDDLVADGEE